MSYRLDVDLDDEARRVVIAAGALGGVVGLWVGWLSVPDAALMAAMPTEATPRGPMLAYQPIGIGLPLLTAALLGVVVWAIVSVAAEVPADGDVIQQWAEEERESVEARRAEMEEPVMRARSRAPAAAAALRNGATVEEALDRAGLDDGAARDVLRPALEDLQRWTDGEEVDVDDE